MKLRKQTGLKAALVAVTGGLFLAFLGLIRSDPGISAEPSDPGPTPPPTPSVDPYRRFFAPDGTNRGGSVQPAPQSNPNPAPQNQTRPHTRTRAS